VLTLSAFRCSRLDNFHPRLNGFRDSKSSFMIGMLSFTCQEKWRSCAGIQKQTQGRLGSVPASRDHTPCRLRLSRTATVADPAENQFDDRTSCAARVFVRLASGAGRRRRIDERVRLNR